MKHLSLESTYVSLGLLVAVIGFTAWLTVLYAQTDANAKTLIQVSEQQTEYTRNLQLINMRLSRIEGKLGVNH